MSALTDDAILATLSAILGDLIGDPVTLTLATTRPEVPRWDSFTYVTFIVAVESFKTVGDIVTAIRTLRGA